MTSAGNDNCSRRRWLCIAYSFPPINRSGTHRTLAFVRYLAARGWDASVLTVEPTSEPVDGHLESLVPTTVDVTRTACPDLIENVKRLTRIGRIRENRGASATATVSPDGGVPDQEHNKRGLREWVSRILQTPDSRLGWYRPGRRAGRSILRSRPYDVIYSTSPCMTAHLIARRLSRSFGIPWVADFRDPWGDNPFRDLPFNSLAWWDGFLERRVLRDAEHVICNTPTMRDRLCERLPFVHSKSSVIMNGYDAERMQGVTPVRPSADNEFVLTHAGQFYGKRSPLPLFRALRRVLHNQDVTERPIRLVLVGPECCDGVSLMQLARQQDVEAHVSVLGPKTHREALSLMAGSDALLLMGSTGPGSDLQVPNKLFEYLALQRPILAAVSAINPEIEILRMANADYKVASPDDPKALALAIRRLAEPSRLVAADAWSGAARFDRVRRAADLWDVFEHVSGRRPRPEVMTEASELRDLITPGSDFSLTEDNKPVPAST